MCLPRSVHYNNVSIVCLHACLQSGLEVLSWVDLCQVLRPVQQKSDVGPHTHGLTFAQSHLPCRTFLCRYRDQYPELQIYNDCVVINDAYPKARCHALVIARQEGLKGPMELGPQHLPLLHSMKVK